MEAEKKANWYRVWVQYPENIKGYGADWSGQVHEYAVFAENGDEAEKLVHGQLMLGTGCYCVGFQVNDHFATEKAYWRSFERGGWSTSYGTILECIEKHKAAFQNAEPLLVLCLYEDNPDGFRQPKPVNPVSRAAGVAA